MINCAYIGCKHNTFKITADMKKFILQGGFIAGSGKCCCSDDVNLKLDEEHEEFLICENYEEMDKLNQSDILVNSFDHLLSGLKVPLIVIYEKPLDYPDKYVARQWDADKPSNIIILDIAYEGLRSKLPKYGIQLKRSQKDDACIIETWVYGGRE